MAGLNPGGDTKMKVQTSDTMVMVYPHPSME